MATEPAPDPPRNREERRALERGVALDRGRGMTVTDVAAGLGVSRKTVLRWTRSGQLEAFHLGRRVIIFTADLDVFLESRRAQIGGVA